MTTAQLTILAAPKTRPWAWPSRHRVRDYYLNLHYGGDEEHDDEQKSMVMLATAMAENALSSIVHHLPFPYANGKACLCR